jgi:uncharacterized protein DUF3108
MTRYTARTLGMSLALGASAAGDPLLAAQEQPPAADSTSYASSMPFGIGERLTYDVKFGPVKVGSGSMEVAGIVPVRGRDAWHTVFRVKGGTFFYRVNDVLESWFDAQTFSSLRFVQDFEEGGKNRERTYEIYPDRGVFVEEKKDGSQTEEPTVQQPLDDGSFLYFVRTIPLLVGQTYEFSRYFRPDRNPVIIRVLRREKVKVPAGTFEAVVIQPIIKAKGIFSENGQAELWLTDDNRRMMVQMKSKLSFGSLNLYLRSYTPAGVTAKAQ